MAGVAILSDKVCPNMDLLRSGSCLSQPQMADLSIGFGCLQPTLAEPPLDAGRLKLLFKEVDLGTERLALFVHNAVSIDFSHELPIVDGEFVEFAAEGGVCSPTPSKGGNEPCR